MAGSPVIVLERDAHWAVGLRSELAVLRIRIYETRSWNEVWEMLAREPVALVAAELTEPGIDTLLAATVRIARWHPQAGLVVLAERRLAAYRDLLREAGALHFITSPRRLAEVTEIVRRRAAQATAATSTGDLLDDIRRNLPFNPQSAP